jgi:predicted transcriptional regulator of viral defense system
MVILDFLTELTAKGYCTFTFIQAKKALEVSDIALRAALRRLKQKKALAQPLKGFYVIVPPEYRILGCRPADHFIHELMQYMCVPYYAGLLSAAQYYGAAHHRPQQFQLVTNRKRRAIVCGQVKIVFITRKDIKEIPTQNFNAPQGIVIVSSPEATAMDMVTYPHRCGGLDNVLTVLTSLVEKMDPKKLTQLASKTSEITWVQRLGYLLDTIKANDLRDALIPCLKSRRIHVRTLVFSSKKSLVFKTFSKSKKIVYKSLKAQNVSPRAIKKSKSSKWKLIINKKLEPDI